MNLSWRRIGGIVRKEVREYRRNRQLIVTMAIFPLVFLIQPLVAVFLVPESGSAELSHGHALLYLLGIPVLVPATIAAAAIAGERQQGTLEPVLTTPIRREEFLLGKALAVLIPSVVIAYGVYTVFLVAVKLFAQPGVASGILQVPDILAQVVYTPLIACWAIWVGIAISTRASDARVAQQLSLLGNLPLVALSSLISLDIIHATLRLALVLGAALLLGDVLGWRIVAPLFDRERLISDTR